MGSTVVRRVRRSREVAHRQVEGQTVIIAPHTGEVIVLNSSGTLVWDLSDGERDVEEVAAEIAKQFVVNIDVAKADVAQLYDELIGAGVAQSVP